MKPISQQQANMPEQQAPAETPACKPCKPILARWSFWIPFTLAFGLAVAAGVLLYFSWEQRTEFINRVSQLEGESGMLAGEKLTLEIALREAQEQLASVRPYVYVDGITALDSGNEVTIHAVDVITNEDRIVAEGPYRVLAVPERGYDGRIFLTRNTASAADSALLELDIATGEVSDHEQNRSFRVFGAPASVVVSPDQVWIAIAYDNPIATSLGSRQKSLWAINLLTGEEQELLRIQPDEYFAEFYGENVFAGASNPVLQWISPECVTAVVFEDVPETETPDQKKWKGQRAACVSEAVSP